MKHVEQRHHHVEVDASPSTKDQIGLAIFCRSCEEDRPRAEGAVIWHRLKVGGTKEGIQVVCARCGRNVAHLKFWMATNPTTT